MIVKKTWTKVKVKNANSEAKAARYAHRVVLLDSTLYIFGGYVEDKGWLNDLCTISLKKDV